MSKDETAKVSLLSDNFFLEIGKYRLVSCIDSLIRKDATMTDEEFAKKLVETVRPVWQEVEFDQHMPEILTCIRQIILGFNVASDEVKKIGEYQLKFQENEETEGAYIIKRVDK